MTLDSERQLCSSCREESQFPADGIKLEVEFPIQLIEDFDITCGVGHSLLRWSQMKERMNAVSPTINSTISSLLEVFEAEFYKNVTFTSITGLKASSAFNVIGKTGSFAVACEVNTVSGKTGTDVEIFKAINAVGHLYVINNSPKRFEENVTFLLFADRVGDDSKFTVDFDDGTTEEISTPSLDANITQLIPSWITPPFTPEETPVVVFQHSYQRTGQYKVRVNGTNLVSLEQTSGDVFIQAGICYLPTIDMLGMLVVKVFL